MALTTAPARAAAPDVVTTIPPLHSLASAVMHGVGTPELLLPPGASPHEYALKPSDARTLTQAEVVFWIGEPLESFLVRPLKTMAADARIVALASAPGLTLHHLRAGGQWEPHHHHHHEDGDDAAHAEHAAEHEHEHDHEEHADHDHHDDAYHDEDGHDHDHDHDGHDDSDHDHEGHEAGLSDDAATLPADTDPHIWLDPHNAIIIAQTMAKVLAEADPADAETYTANAEALANRLKALEADLATQLAPVSTVPYIVFHDAYHYFEDRFGLSPAGSITVEPGRPVGARRITTLRTAIKDRHAACVFAEPQFEPRLIATMIEGTDAGTGTLDPLGADLPLGEDLYPTLLQNMADSLTACLSPS